MEICAVTKSPVNPSKIPIDYVDLLSDTQLAIEIISMLPDKWDSNTGGYQGKDLTILPYLMDLYEVQEPTEMLSLIMKIIMESSDITNKKINNESKKWGKKKQ